MQSPSLPKQQGNHKGWNWLLFSELTWVFISTAIIVMTYKYKLFHVLSLFLPSALHFRFFFPDNQMTLKVGKGEEEKEKKKKKQTQPLPPKK